MEVEEAIAVVEEEEEAEQLQSGEEFSGESPNSTSAPAEEHPVPLPMDVSGEFLPTTEFNCHFCSLTFESQTELLAHVLILHNPSASCNGGFQVLFKISLN